MAAFFAPDLAMTDMPRGRDFDLAETTAVLSAFLDRSPRLRIELLRLSVSGPAVFTERIDHMVLDGRPLSMPVAAVFEFAGGRIRRWREYYDRGPLLAAAEDTGGSDAA
jgi:limonene-1,2-epoxide hydrolase